MSFFVLLSEKACYNEQLKEMGGPRVSQKLFFIKILGHISGMMEYCACALRLAMVLFSCSPLSPIFREPAADMVVKGIRRSGDFPLEGRNYSYNIVRIPYLWRVSA